MGSRATFYRNYQDKYDLVEQIFAEAMRALFDAVSDPGTEHPPRIWVCFFEHIAEYERLYGALLGQKGSMWFVSKMRSSLVALIKQYEQMPVLQPADSTKTTFTDDYVRNLLAALLVETITWWLAQGRPYSPQEMAWRSAALASAIFKETSTWKSGAGFQRAFRHTRLIWQAQLPARPAKIIPSLPGTVVSS